MREMHAGQCRSVTLMLRARSMGVRSSTGGVVGVTIILAMRGLG